MENQATWGAAVRGVGVQFREFFSETLKDYTPSWSPVVQTITDDSAQASFSGKTGAGILTRFSEGSTIPKKNRYKLHDTAFAHDQYGGQIEVTRKHLMNRDFNASFDEFKDLTSSAMVTLSKAPAQIFNGGFVTTSVVNGIKLTRYGDGDPLFSTLHTPVDGSSDQSNASSTSIPLTENNLETARVALLEQLQDDQTPITFTGSLYLVVPTALEKEAKIITDSTLRSDTSNNDINIYSGGSINLMSSHWLGATNSGSDTAWFVVAPDVAKLVLVMRTSPNTDQSVDKNTKSTLFDVIVDFSVGHYDYKGSYGSKGDNSSYSS